MRQASNLQAGQESGSFSLCAIVLSLTSAVYATIKFAGSKFFYTIGATAMIRNLMIDTCLAIVLLATLAPPAHAHLDPVIGACDVLDSELLDTLSHLIVTDVGVSECDFDSAGLSPGGLEILIEGTAGGSSVYSEILAHEIALQCEQAVLLKTETEIIYTNPNGKKTDMLVMIDTVKIGISVTRAIVFPPGTPLSPAQAQSLLEDKLSDIIASSANVDPADAWQKQILLVETPSSADRDLLLSTVPLIDAGLRDDTIVWVVQTDGEDEFLYFGPAPECDATSVPVVASRNMGLLAYPNPFNPVTTIAFTLPVDGPVSVTVFDLSGRRSRTLADATWLNAGVQSLQWDGRGDNGGFVGSGVYLIRVASNAGVATHRAVLVK